MGIFKSASNASRARPGQPSPPNIRGKISGPIPIDDEFPMRQPGTSIARGSPPRQLHESRPEQENAVVHGDVPPEVTREDKAASVAHSGPSQVSHTNTPSQRRATTRNSNWRYSAVSNATGSDQPHRKKSSLRSTLSKLFGRKRKDSRQTSDPDVNGGVAESHHHSDPPVVSRTISQEEEPKRSASLPITEYGRALRSHSIGPDDIIAITSARNSLQAEFEVNRRRTGGTRSRIWSGQIKDFDGELIGLTPRPASTHGRGSALLDDENAEIIGRAITSCDSINYRRRSRSLSQLPEIAGGLTLTRKRSDEIRYWRESYTQGLLSPNLSTSNPDDANVGIIDSETPVESPAEAKPKTPLQPFNFDPLVGMKITQAASLEDRIAHVEVRNQKLEKLISQLFQVVPGVSDYAIPPPPAPRIPSSTYTTTSAAAPEPSSSQAVPHVFSPTIRYSVSNLSNESFGDGNTFIGSIPPSARPAQRPVSTATVRGATSLPLLRDKQSNMTTDQYATLKALLDTERAARQVLEAQVQKLGHQVNIMSRTSHKLDTDLQSSVLSNISAFEHDEDEDDEDDEPSESEAYKTPREERPDREFGAFGEELRDEEDDGSRKKAARTLSLSQLTLGKPSKKRAIPPPSSSATAAAGVDL